MCACACACACARARAGASTSRGSADTRGRDGERTRSRARECAGFRRARAASAAGERGERAFFRCDVSPRRGGSRAAAASSDAAAAASSAARSPGSSSPPSYLAAPGPAPARAPSPLHARAQDDFFAKKSVLISQLDQFDKLIEARDSSGLGKDSRDYIRLKVQINGELRKLEDAVKDLAEQNKREVEKRGSKLGADDIAARREVLEAVIGEFQTKFKMAKGFSSAGAAENLGGGAGMRVLSREQVMKGQFAGAGIKTKQEAASAARAPRARRARASMRRACVRWAGERARARVRRIRWGLTAAALPSPALPSRFPPRPPPSLPPPPLARS